MTATANAVDLRQYKSRFFLIVDQTDFRFKPWLENMVIAMLEK